ncbi:MAG: hypothetical protein M0R66_07215 [Candidatus Omnitrophica bacterium]|nr:hypothetical protein [Candidatus Omnitrophota bacterium]
MSGIVVDALDGFRVLVRPPPDVIRDDGAVAYCLRNIADYDVYRALDGTRITLYWVPRVGQWLMSTARSYDARGFRWIGARTYAEAFADALGREINWDALDKGEIYSFIFRHRDFHPLARDAPGVWQISGPALDGIAQYKPLARADIPSAERMRFAAARAFSMCATAGEVFYGYIFRARSGDDTVEKQPRASPAAVFLESTLHAFVREGMYDIPPHVTGLTWETRPIYLHLRAYMAIGSAHAHVAMFPRAESVYSRMDYILSMLTDITVAEMRATRGRAGGARVATREQSEIGESLFGGAWARVYAAIARIAVTVARHLVETGAIGAFGDHVRANVRDQYMNKENMPEFMGILAMK